jgi:hypothetical protein
VIADSGTREDLLVAADEAAEITPTPKLDAAPKDQQRRWTLTLVGVSAAALVIELAVLWNFQVNPFRTALPNGVFSNFFDLQARALLDGRLDLPRGSLSIEGFVLRGREYTYFPPFPALLRLPVFVVTDRFDGRLTAPSMLLAWIVTAIATGRLTWRVRRLVRGDAPVDRFELVLAGAVQISVLCGSVVLFLASLPWVYHEVYAWSIALTIGALSALVGVLDRPSVGGAVAAGAWTLCAILTRTTAGWACVLALSIGAVVLWRRRTPAQHRSVALGLALAGLVALAAGIAVNWAKFRHPYMFPLQHQVWTSVNPHRRSALEANGGDLVSLKMLPSTTINYLRPDGIRFVPWFPFVTLPANPARSYGGSVLDQTYRTASVTASAPILMIMAAVGIVGAAHRRGKVPALLLVPLIGAAAILGGVMFYGYIAYRYTSEFMPLLVIGSAIGAAVLANRASAWSLRRRRAVTAAVLAAACYGVAVNGAFAIREIAINNPGVELRDYVIIQDKVGSITGNALKRTVNYGTALPYEGPADHLFIVRECDALFVGTGETFAPWAAVEVRERAFELTVTSRRTATSIAPVRLELLTTSGLTTQRIFLEDFGLRGYRIVMQRADGPEIRSETLFAPAPGSTAVLTIRPMLDRDEYVVSLRDERTDRTMLVIPLSERDANWFTLPVLLGPPSGALSGGGWEIQPVDMPTPLSCLRFSDAAR